MEEELNENDLEDRLYAMLHHVDETQANVQQSTQNEPPRVVEAGSVRRYWRDPPPPQRFNSALKKVNNPLQKINTPKEPVNKPSRPLNDKNKPKAEQHSPEEPSRTVDLSILLSTPPQNLVKSIEILDHNDQVLELESSDEDEVIEVALPPKPTITIESSDEEEPQPKVLPTVEEKPEKRLTPEKAGSDRDVCASPVPSIVSSVSDEFIRGDCIALNISSRRSDNHSFDFGLHGSDLLGQETPSREKKRKRNKEAPAPNTATSTPIIPQDQNQTDECFATPKSKSKNKRQKKTYSVHDKSVPNPDIYDSDSNQSLIDTNKQHQSYTVTEKSLPSADVYESDSSQPESINCVNKSKQLNTNNNKADDFSKDIELVQEKPLGTPLISKRNGSDEVQNESIIDLTNNSDYITLDQTTADDSIQESFVMANVTGFEECDNYSDIQDWGKSEKGKFGSTKIPAILNEDLDFDNMKGIDRVCSKRKYSLTTLRAEMEKFYNESWGGEDFNHREIQKNMSRDKNLWMIDPKDRMPSLSKRKVTCNFCNRIGHRDDKCRVRPPVCYMCGSTGHYEPRCPAKICVNCGSPNQMYSSMCRNCCSWNRIICAECGQGGHPSSHCPDLWRRYHNTVDFSIPLVDNNLTKKYHQLSCSGCTRRGHLIHNCRSTIPFSGLPINSPYVFSYNPIYFPQNYDQRYQPGQKQIQDYNAYTTGHKRQSKSPIAYDTHVNKKRNLSGSETADTATKSPNVNRGPRKMSITKNSEEAKSKEPNKDVIEPEDPNKLPDFIPIGSSNHDKKGQMIQDNEVSDTSDVITSARIYVTNEIIEKLKQNEGQEWLKNTSEKLNIDVQTTDVNSFICIKGKFGDQEAFQSELREWTRINVDMSIHHNDTLLDTEQSQLSENIPKNRFNLLRKITKALASLKEDIGDPKALYKELTYLQNRHTQLLNCKVISPKQLSNNRINMNTAHKKLNMVLLGQAGLADGSKHVLELTSLHEKLCNLRQKHIPTDVREEVGHHYHTIFSASPRDDYSELVKKYYVSNQSLNSFKKKKKVKLSNISPKRVQKILNTIPSPVKNPFAEKNSNQQEINNKQTLFNKTMGKLSFFHRRLLRSKPMDTILKKTRTELVRKLHTQMSSLANATALSSKTTKKTKKILKQTRRFLKNV